MSTHSRDRKWYYESVANWARSVLEATSQRPLLIGINGPQGCGKSTLGKSLVEDILPKSGIRGVAFSIDDFYLTRAEQVALAQKHPFNPYLQQRGYPGTHDIILGTRILNSLKCLRSGETLRCPIYDKSKFEGMGDRLPESEWKIVEGPLDVIFLEGWMLGFQSAPESSLPNEHFVEINQFLESYKAWYCLLDAFIHLMPLDISYVLKWRVEAEQKMKEQGRAGMTQKQIEDYVIKFIPAYRTFLPLLLKNPPTIKNCLQLTLAEDRLPN